MAGITATGVGSNLDVSGLVNKLMEVEQQPLDKLATKKAAVELRISAFGSFRGALSSFQNTLVALEQSSAYSTTKATVGDSNVVSATSANDADLGNHTLEVTNLAVAHRLKSGTFTSLTDSVGTGQLTIDFGSTAVGGAFTPNSDKTSQTLTIDTAHSSVSGVRDAINAAKLGVTASVVNDGTGFRLVLTSKDTGSKNSVRISVTDDDGNNTNTSGLSKLAYDPAALVTGGMEQVAAAEDATFLLDGIQITKASNTVSDVLTGTTLSLLKENTGSPTSLSVAQDTAPLKTAVDNFVKAYNDLDTNIDELTKFNAETKTAGTLNGDATLRTMASQIRDALTSVVSNGPEGFHGLAQIGISVNRSGQLTVDSGKLSDALRTNSKGVQALFATNGTSTDSLVKYVRADSTTKAGAYDLNVTQVATRGEVLGWNPASLIIDASNDALTVSVDGVSTSVSLTRKTYASAAELATELQTKLNGGGTLLAAGAAVTVSESSGVLTVTSNKYGSASKVALLGGTAQTALFGVAPTTTDGKDVAGTLGLVTGTGLGKQFSHPNGLVISVEGGTTGARGTVQFSRGIAVKLDDMIGKALGSKGLIASRNESMQGEIKQITTDSEHLTAQLLVKRARYQKQFNTLDELLTNMQSTMTYLSQQLSSLNNLK